MDRGSCVSQHAGFWGGESGIYEPESDHARSARLVDRTGDADAPPDEARQAVVLGFTICQNPNKLMIGSWIF